MSSHPTSFPQLLTLSNRVGDAGIEPAWSRLRIECISHLCQSPIGAGCWNRTNASRLSIAGSTFELILHWCAVRELNPHLFFVRELFWSVELPAQTSIVGQFGTSMYVLSPCTL